MGIKSVIPVDKNKMIQLHKEGKSDKEIAEILGCTRPNVTVYLNQNGYTNRKSKIQNTKLRNRISQSLIGRYTGDKNPNYKGYGEINTIARGIFKTFSKRKMRECDFTCAICSKRGGDIETHHIKPFHVILEEFITGYYNGDKNTIYDQLMSYDDFTDESNLVVLCRECHKWIHSSDNHDPSLYKWEGATTIETATA